MGEFKEPFAASFGCAIAKAAAFVRHFFDACENVG
jgi:hypothetical protein